MGLSFSQQMEAWAKKTGETMEDHTVATRMDMSKNVLQRTPVKTGRARASWVATIGNPSTIEFGEQEEYPSDSTLLNMMRKESNKKPDDVFWLTSNLHYIRDLEYGASLQAPEGMVRVTIAEFKDRMRALLR